MQDKGYWNEESDAYNVPILVECQMKDKNESHEYVKQFFDIIPRACLGRELPTERVSRERSYLS